MQPLSSNSYPLRFQRTFYFEVLQPHVFGFSKKFAFKRQSFTANVGKICNSETTFGNVRENITVQISCAIYLYHMHFCSLIAELDLIKLFFPKRNKFSEEFFLLYQFCKMS